MATTNEMRPYDDLMGDGYARGVAGDTKIMRMYYRTAASIGKFADNHGFDSRACVCHYTNTGKKPIKNYLIFCQQAQKNYVPSPVGMVIIPPIEAQPIDMPLAVHIDSDEELTV